MSGIVGAVIFYHHLPFPRKHGPHLRGEASKVGCEFERKAARAVLETKDR